MAVNNALFEQNLAALAPHLPDSLQEMIRRTDPQANGISGTLETGESKAYSFRWPYYDDNAFPYADLDENEED